MEFLPGTSLPSTSQNTEGAGRPFIGKLVENDDVDDESDVSGVVFKGYRLQGGEKGVVRDISGRIGVSKAGRCFDNWQKSCWTVDTPPCTSQISRSCSPSLKGPVVIVVNLFSTSSSSSYE